MALLLLSAVVSGWDADVTRKKRGPRARAEAPSWWAFRLPVPSPPARAPRCCDDCGTTKTGQWRSGPMGPGTLCNTCGARRWSAGERWGMRRRRRRAAATTVSDQPPQENRPDSESPPDGRICEQELLAPAAAPKRVMSLPPATESLPALEMAMAAGSEQLPSPPEIPASQSSPPDSTDGNQIARSKPAKRKSPSPTTTNSLPAPPEIPASSENSPPNKKKKNKTAAENRQCVHCGSSTTPQWRGGPDGRRSLCNACGVRHRQGRLLPEYRPQASPTFDKENHASLHSKVLEFRRQRSSTNQQPPAPAQQQPVDVDLMALPRPVDDHLGSELRGGTTDGDSANNAGASSSAMAQRPVGERGWLQLDAFLLDGPPAPMLVDKEGWIVID